MCPKNVYKYYDLFIIRLKLDEISAKTQKHQLFFPAKFSTKIVIRDQGEIRWRYVTGGTRRSRYQFHWPIRCRSRDIWLNNSILHFESSVTIRNVFTAMQRSILRFSIRNFDTVFVMPVQNYLVPGFIIFRFLEEFQSFFYYVGGVSGHVSLSKKTKKTARHISVGAWTTPRQKIVPNCVILGAACPTS